MHPLSLFACFAVTVIVTQEITLRKHFDAVVVCKNYFPLTLSLPRTRVAHSGVG